MTTRAEEDRIRQEQGERFLKQLQDMFTTTRTDMASLFMPRAETQARMDHQDEMIEKLTVALEKLTSNVGNFHENVPHIYAERAETKAELGELRIEIEKLKTQRESDMQRDYGARFEDMKGRFKGDEKVERGWRTNAQESTTQMLAWVIGGGFVLLSAAVSIILTITRR